MSVVIDLSGKTALVTGSSQGIGAAVARTLVAAGADLSGVELRRTLADGLRFACELPAKK